MSRMDRVLMSLTGLIGGLAAVAAGLGVFWQGSGGPVEFVSLRGEAVAIYGRGLYAYDSVSMVTQAMAQDVVTLVLGIPLLMGAAVLFWRGSLRGKLLLAGTLGYFLYTYASYAFGASFNALFLVYVALFSLSLFAFVLAVAAIDVGSLASHFSPRLPRRAIATFLFVLGGFLLVAWLGRIVPSLLTGEPPVGLDAGSTLFIQVLDLGLVVPAAFLSGWLLWRREAWGYLLASVVLLKGFTLSIAVSAMALGMAWAGVPISPVETVVFPLLTVICVGLTAVLLKNVSESEGDGATVSDTAVSPMLLL